MNETRVAVGRCNSSGSDYLASLSKGQSFNLCPSAYPQVAGRQFEKGEKFMRTSRLLGTYRHLIDLALAALAAFALVACVQSEHPLLSGSEPLFGDEFQLNLYEAVTGGLAAPVKISVFRWDAGRYVLVKGEGATGASIVMQPAGGDQTLVQFFDGKAYRYFLARQLAEATYQIMSVDHTADVGMLKSSCVKIDRLDCTIATRAQLDAFVRASVGKPSGAFWGLAVLSHSE
jgi:hypothetical protein